MRVLEISSAHNPQYRDWKALSTSRGIRDQGQFILSGQKLIAEFLENPHHEILGEILPPEMPSVSGSQKVYRLSQKMFDDVDEVGTHYNLLLLKLPEISAWDTHSEPAGLEVVCPLGDPNNLGALIRSAQAFGVQKMILTEESANPFLPRSIKASSGAVLKMKFVRTGKLAEMPKDKNTWALDMDGEAITKFNWPKNLRLVIGEEGPGFSGKPFPQRISIGMHASTESLNATIAASIAFHEYLRQQS